MTRTIIAIYIFFAIGLVLSGCNSAIFQNNTNNRSVSTYSDKKYTPANTDPWKNQNFRKRNSSRWDRTKRRGSLFASSKRNPYKNKSIRPNNKRKGLNRTTLRTDADPNPINSWTAGFGIGPTNSLTDIGGADKGRPLFMDMQLVNTKLNYNVFARYKFTSKLSASGWLTYGKIAASDVYSKSRERAARGFSFSNRIFELSLRGEYSFPYIIVRKNYSGYYTAFDYYLFTGLNAFLHNPNFTSSTPVSDTYTTGYKKTQIAIPFGAGCYFSFPSRVKLGFDIALRKSFFDHLDGITRPGSKASDYYLFANFNLAYTFRVSTLFRKDDSFFKPKLNRKKEKRTKSKSRDNMFFR